jgi:hypothetical protein
MHSRDRLLPIDDPFDWTAPFTPARARAAGVARAALDARVRDGRVRRVLRGVYVDADAADGPELRARALSLVVRRPAVAIDRTAAWVHGVPPVRTRPGLLPPIEVLGRGARTERQLGGPRRLAPTDVVAIAGQLVTTPLRTALDLGRLLAPDRGLAAIDGLMRAGGFPHRELLDQLPRFTRLQGVVQLRTLVAHADPRADGPAESVLRHHWYAADLPTPVPGFVVPGTGLRLALALPVARYGAVVAGRLTGAQIRDLGALGWRVLELGEQRILHSDAELLGRHLQVEFHRHLLREVG